MSSQKKWLMLMHQLPTKPESLRVKVWRNLQKIGALQLKNSVYVLPLAKPHLEKFQNIREEILNGKGDAFLCESKFMSLQEEEEIIDAFNMDRTERYKVVSEELRELHKILGSKKIHEDDLMELEHSIGKTERLLREIENIDFFDCKERKNTMSLFEGVHSKLIILRKGNKRKVEKKLIKNYQGKTWVTRKNVGVDRMASAWLISRFIDKKSSFKFVSDDSYKIKKSEVAFDMFEAEFTHVGDSCTFEVLAESLSVDQKAIKIISEIIHDLDLKDTKFNRPETAGMAIVLEGIINRDNSDEKRLANAFSLFDDLFRTLK